MVHAWLGLRACLSWETDEGIVGEGFICTLKREFTKVLYEMVKSLEPLVVGLDPKMSGTVLTPRPGAASALLAWLAHRSGIAAVDCALWDLRGKAGMNVAHLFGAAATSVPVYASGGLWRSLSIDDAEAGRLAF